MKKIIAVCWILICSLNVLAQNVSSTTAETLILKSKTQTQRLSITNPKTGMIVFQSDNQKGIWYFESGAWNYAGSNWTKTGANISYNGNIGINTTNPIAKLHIVGDRIRIESTSPTLNLKNTTSGDDINAVELSANNKIKLANGSIIADSGGGTPTLFIGNNNGNVGVGTLLPNSKLQIKGGDIEMESINSGVILKSPNGSRFRVTVGDAGTLIINAL